MLRNSTKATWTTKNTTESLEHAGNWIAIRRKNRLKWARKARKRNNDYWNFKRAFFSGCWMNDLIIWSLKSHSNSVVECLLALGFSNWSVKKVRISMVAFIFTYEIKYDNKTNKTIESEANGNHLRMVCRRNWILSVKHWAAIHCEPWISVIFIVNCT